MKREESVHSAISHGKYRDRVEVRKIETLSQLPPYTDWPGVKQVCRLERERNVNGKRTLEIVCAITSLTRAQAPASRLLKTSRRHWAIENRLHYVRDVTMGEDASRVRSGSAPQVPAALRNTVIGLIRRTGAKYLPPAVRRFAAKPLEALVLMLPALRSEF